MRLGNDEVAAEFVRRPRRDRQTTADGAQHGCGTRRPRLVEPPDRPLHRPQVRQGLGGRRGNVAFGDLFRVAEARHRTQESGPAGTVQQFHRLSLRHFPRGRPGRNPSLENGGWASTGRRAQSASWIPPEADTSRSGAASNTGRAATGNRTSSFSDSSGRDAARARPVNRPPRRVRRRTRRAGQEDFSEIFMFSVKCEVRLFSLAPRCAFRYTFRRCRFSPILRSNHENAFSRSRPDRPGLHVFLVRRCRASGDCRQLLLARFRPRSVGFGKVRGPAPRSEVPDVVCDRWNGAGEGGRAGVSGRLLEALGRRGLGFARCGGRGRNREAPLLRSRGNGPVHRKRRRPEGVCRSARRRLRRDRRIGIGGIRRRIRRAPGRTPQDRRTGLARRAVESAGRRGLRGDEGGPRSLALVSRQPGMGGRFPRRTPRRSRSGRSRRRAGLPPRRVPAPSESLPRLAGRSRRLVRR